MTIASHNEASLPGRRDWREIARQFTLNLSTMTVGGGIHALALNPSPVMTPALYGVSEWLAMVNIGLFAVSAALHAKRWLLLSPEACRIFDGSVVSMFFGLTLTIIVSADRQLLS